MGQGHFMGNNAIIYQSLEEKKKKKKGKKRKKKSPIFELRLEEKQGRGKSCEHKQIALFIYENVFCIHKLAMPRHFN